MTILVKKVFISSKPTFVYLLCPPLCGPFSIQESAAGGLSYKVKKRLTKHRDYPKLRQALVAIDKLCADLLSTNFFLVEADCYHRFADGTLNLDDALDCCRICVKLNITGTFTPLVRIEETIVPD